jgi:hypothetical protein
MFLSTPALQHSSASVVIDGAGRRHKHARDGGNIRFATHSRAPEDSQSALWEPRVGFALTASYGKHFGSEFEERLDTDSDFLHAGPSLAN